MNPSRPKHAVKFNVPLGQIGQTGVVVPLHVMVEFNHELVNVKMEKKVTVRDLRQVSSNAIEDHVTVGQWCTGMIMKDLLINGAVSKTNIFLPVTLILTDVFHTVLVTMAALLHSLFERFLSRVEKLFTDDVLSLLKC